MRDRKREEGGGVRFVARCPAGYRLGSGGALWHIFRNELSITATVENDTIKLPSGVHLPDGTEVKVFLPGSSVSPEDGATLDPRLEDFIGCIKDGPEDLAAEHDHYAHGTPKRGSR